MAPKVNPVKKQQNTETQVVNTSKQPVLLLKLVNLSNFENAQVTLETEQKVNNYKKILKNLTYQSNQIVDTKQGNVAKVTIFGLKGIYIFVDGPHIGKIKVLDVYHEFWNTIKTTGYSPDDTTKIVSEKNKKLAKDAGSKFISGIKLENKQYQKFIDTTIKPDGTDLQATSGIPEVGQGKKSKENSNVSILVKNSDTSDDDKQARGTYFHPMAAFYIVEQIHELMHNAVVAEALNGASHTLEDLQNQLAQKDKDHKKALKQKDIYYNNQTDVLAQLLAEMRESRETTKQQLKETKKQGQIDRKQANDRHNQMMKKLDSSHKNLANLIMGITTVCKKAPVSYTEAKKPKQQNRVVLILSGTENKPIINIIRGQSSRVDELLSSTYADKKKFKVIWDNPVGSAVQTMNNIKLSNKLEVSKLTGPKGRKVNNVISAANTCVIFGDQTVANAKLEEFEADCPKYLENLKYAETKTKSKSLIAKQRLYLEYAIAENFIAEVTRQLNAEIEQAHLGDRIIETAQNAESDEDEEEQEDEQEEAEEEQEDEQEEAEEEQEEADYEEESKEN